MSEKSMGYLIAKVATLVILFVLFYALSFFPMQFVITLSVSSIMSYFTEVSGSTFMFNFVLILNLLLTAVISFLLSRWIVSKLFKG